MAHLVLTAAAAAGLLLGLLLRVRVGVAKGGGVLGFWCGVRERDSRDDNDDRDRGCCCLRAAAAVARARPSFAHLHGLLLMLLLRIAVAAGARAATANEHALLCCWPGAAEPRRVLPRVSDAMAGGSVGKGFGNSLCARRLLGVRGSLQKVGGKGGMRIGICVWRVPGVEGERASVVPPSSAAYDDDGAADSAQRR